MLSRRFKRIVAWAGIIALISFATYHQIESAITRLRIAFADEQTAIFEDMREKARQADTKEATEFLTYVLNYYPSGTKQATGSTLDRIVDRARRDAVREIITLLRNKTHQDYGDDPQRWIKALDGSKTQ
jgi:hypothetical protein